MKILEYILKKWMLLFSQINSVEGPWEGFSLAKHAKNSREKIDALLSVSESRYKESSEYKFEDYFPTNFLEALKGKDILEIGSNNGGASLYFYENYRPKTFTGIEVTEEHITVSNLFFNKHGIKDGYIFIKGFAENLPFKSDSFDAILSFDTFEHVNNVADSLDECYRVLRKGGKAYIVFPSYYQPGAHHLNIVTTAPIIHWIFSPKILTKVFFDILDENPEYRDYRGINKRNLYDYEKLLDINGTTFRKFKKILKNQNWTSAMHQPIALCSTGKVGNKNKILKYIGSLLYLGTKIPLFQEFCNHRIVYILEK